MKNYQTVTPEKLRDFDSKNSVIIDVRSKVEHEGKRLRCSHIHAPLDQLDPQNLMQKHGLNEDAEIYFLCRSGGRARQAADRFFNAGFTNLKIIEGGLSACESCGEAVEGYETNSCSVKKNCPISLERQVRIAAGALTFFGTVCAIIFHPIFLTVPLFVGGGLVFAGVTDRCGMALLLLRAPWNK
ncbi:MAG: rhodanese-like domain-containing protein [Alphaproteobacteria bacterium]|nr:rhodanese-like domain-containing protein [Alphaproteobacteria bacterium]